MDDFKKSIKELTEINGNCGYEDEVIKYLVGVLKDNADEVRVDSIGNLTVVYKSGIENAKKVMLFAHMDEVGMVVRKIEDNGIIRVQKLGLLILMFYQEQ